MATVKGNGIILICAVLILAGATSAGAGIPNVENHFITDVTTVSFSVIWAASEPSTAAVEVFDDENGTTPTASAVVVAHPVNSGDALIRAAAEDNGVMKVMVTGLAADTTYYFRTVTTSKSTSEITTFPETTPLKSVTTEAQTTRTYNDGGNILPFSNDVIIEPCYLEDGTTVAEGTLLLATVAGGNYPVTAFVGDGVDLPYALLDLNNVFGRDSNENLDLMGGINLTLVNFRGIGGYSIVTHDLPDDNSLAEIKAGELHLKTGWNFVSIQVELENNDLSTVLADIWENVVSVWTFDTPTDHWLRYDKNNPLPWLNDLTSLEFGKGYWIQTSQDVSLKCHGLLPPSDAAIQLHSGWNQVGFKSFETVVLGDAMGPIDTAYLSIWTYNTSEDRWLRYDKNNPLPWLNDLNEITPGSAYWIEVTEGAQW